MTDDLQVPKGNPLRFFVGVRNATLFTLLLWALICYLFLT